MKNKILKNENLFEDIKTIIDNSYKKVNFSVNYLLIQRNWHIGKRICKEKLTNRKDDYGKKVIKELSIKLTSLYGKGFDLSNLYNYVNFFLMFPNIFDSVRRKSLLTWTHYRILLHVNDKNARDWYANEAYNECWSVRTLNRNISSQYYYRMLSSFNKEAVHN